MSAAGIQKKRPNLSQWLGYSFGGGLPPELKEWVLKDTTSWSWVLRVIGRSFTYLLVPIIVVIAFVPASLIIRIGCCVCGGFVGLAYATVYCVETTEHRLIKAGFPPGHGEYVRKKRVFGDDYNPDA
jgi:hypothetical protein